MKNILIGNKIHFTSLGCARNLVDTEVMLGILLRAGYEATPHVEEADYLVINTCGFLESARQEGRQTIDEMFEGKKASAKVIVAGCMVRLHKEQLKEEFPDIHYFIGAGDVEKIIDAVRADEAGFSVSSARSYLEAGEVPRQISTPRHYAYLKIAEGCRKQCSFCIIPKIKGKLKSKEIAQVVSEFKLLINSGAKEVILIAQDLGDFGKERGQVDGLYQLLKSLSAIPGEFWIRLLYLYPDEITPEIIQLMKDDERICPYLDMPIQHINDRVLKAMKRTTSRQHIVDTIKLLRAEIPHMVIRTSLMVGFPGESEQEFKELVDFVKSSHLDNIGIFSYSREEESTSAALPEHLPDEIKENRLKRLALAQQKALKASLQKYVGQRLKVLIDGYHPESEQLLRGHHAGQCPEIDGCVIINDWHKVKEFGQFYEVEITDIAGYDLVGRVVASYQKEKTRSTKKSLAIVA